MPDIVELLIVFGAMVATALLVVGGAWIALKARFSKRAKVVIGKARRAVVACVPYFVLWFSLYAGFTLIKPLNPTWVHLVAFGMVFGLVIAAGPRFLNILGSQIATLSSRLSVGWRQFLTTHQLLVWIGVPVTIWCATIVFLGWWLGTGDGGFHWWDRSDWLSGAGSAQRSAAEVRTEEIRNLIGMMAVLLGSLAAAFTLGNTLHRTSLQDAEHQTNRDRLNADAFSKAVEQLSNDNTAIRLGAIYSMESLARAQAPRATGVLVVRQVMETIAAFVRSRTQQDEDDQQADDEQNDLFDHEPPPGKTDVAISAALLVLLRSYPHHHRPSLARQGGVDLRRVQLPNVELPANVDFRSFDLRDSYLAGIQSTGANFSGTRLSSAQLRAAQLESASFRDAVLVSTDFTLARLTGADFTNAATTSTDFSKASLNRAVFRHLRTLGRMKFTSAMLVEARLDGCLFTESDFSMADLANALIRNSVFSGCTLASADLAGADVTGTTFIEGTEMTGVVFEVAPTKIEPGRRVKGLTPKQLLGARWDPKKPPIWPSNFTAPHDGTGVALANSGRESV